MISGSTAGMKACVLLPRCIRLKEETEGLLREKARILRTGILKTGILIKRKWLNKKG